MTNRRKIVYLAAIVTSIVLLTGCDASNYAPAATQNPASVFQIDYNKSFRTSQFNGSGDCAGCHNALRSNDGKNISIQEEWAGTMMANSAKDPLWQAKVQTEMMRFPDLNATLDTTCTDCHAPMGLIQSRTDGSYHGTLVEEVNNPQSPYYAPYFDGTSCMLCHRIENAPNLGQLSSFSGGYAIDTNLTGTSRLIYGQYTGVYQNAMQQDSNVTPLHGVQIAEPKMCATCHNLKTPFVKANTQEPAYDFSKYPELAFPEQMIYTEWENSAYNNIPENAQTCQQCHMPQYNNVKIASYPSNMNPRDSFRAHEFLGTNTFLMDILRRYASVFDATDVNFTSSIQNAKNNLNSAASLTLSIPVIKDGSIVFDVNVTSNTGHKLPTGFPSRRAWLHVSVTDSNGITVFESGKPNTDGSISGVNADADRSTYEPHYETITSTEQVQVYESIMKNSDNKVNYALLAASGYLKDNRILAYGMDKNSLVSDIEVIGNAADDANFAGGSDTVTYDINISTASIQEINVQLLYQAVSYAFMQDLFSFENNLVKGFEAMQQHSQYRYELIDEAVYTFP